MNTRRKAGREIGGAAVGVIQVPSQAPTARIEMPINPAGLRHGEVRTTCVQMDKARTLQA